MTTTSPARRGRRLTMVTASLALGALATVAMALAISYSIARVYRAAATDRRTQVEVVNLEGDAWGLHGVLGAAIDGAPLPTISRAIEAIGSDMDRSVREIRRLGSAASVAGLLTRLAGYRAAVEREFSRWRAGDVAQARARYVAQNRSMFEPLRETSSAARESLGRSAAAAERRGGSVTMAVLLVTGVAVFVLARQLSNYRRRRIVIATQDAEQRRFRALIERAPDLITMWSPAGDIIYDSPSVERLLGRAPEERVGTKAASIAHPDDQALLAKISEELRDDPGGSRVAEFRVRHADGTYRWIEGTATNLCEEPEVGGYVANYRIIDERKRGEEIRHGLMSRLIHAQEEERRRIAADIHDDSVQVMAAVQLRLHGLTRAVGEEERARTLQHLEETVRMAILRLRRLLFELRPASLDRDGLTAALAANLDLMARETGMRHSIESTLAREPGLDTRVVLYRVAQEALANVRKHSGARHVRVETSDHGGGALVRIVDDGVGFDPSRQGPAGHLGLAAMRERADEIGGWITVESAPGRGTTVSIWAPGAGERSADKAAEAGAA